MSHDTWVLAAVQHAPVFLDRAATIEKACRLIEEAGSHGARLIVFPETFIPAYPVWAWVVPASRNDLMTDLYAELVEQAVDIPGPDIDTLAAAACKAGAYVVMGANERNVDGSGTSLYNSLAYIDDHGNLLGKHRKLVPTGPERMVWMGGDGSTLETFPTALGKLGGLICWENYMPLARYAMYSWGVQIYVAPTWDSGEPWLSTLRHIAKEGRVYVVGCCMAMRLADIPDRYAFKSLYGKEQEWVNVGDSMIVDPNGKIIAGPAHQTQEIVYAEIDSRLATGLRWKLDVAGHYARPDVFQLTVNRTPSPFIGILNHKAGSDGATICE
jgi:nitrilase